MRGQVPERYCGTKGRDLLSESVRSQAGGLLSLNIHTKRK